jgi:hypothetical protein
MTAGFHVSNVDYKVKLRIHLDKYRNREYKETPLLDSFGELSEIVGRSYGGDAFKASLLLIYDVLMRKEQERKAPELTHSSGNRDGLDVLNFLFDLVNHISGYTEKYYDDMTVKHADLVARYRAEKDTYEGRINESPLLGDHHPHCLLVIEGCQRFFEMSPHGDKNLARNYLDTMILRLNVTPSHSSLFRMGLTPGTGTTSP